MATVICDQCGADCAQFASTFTTGYGTDPETGKRYCFPCCGLRDAEQLMRDGKGVLYLTCDGPVDAKLTNWPGTLKLRVDRVRKGRHNIARTRYDVWFAGPDGAQWHGVQYGENTQICHVHRLKT